MHEESLKGLTPGRIVHYVLPSCSYFAGEHRPAIVAQVWNKGHESHPGMSNLVVFKGQSRDGGDQECPVMSVGSVSYDPTGAPGTWHWPEREE